MSRIQSSIKHIMYAISIKQQLNSNVMHDIMQYNQTQNAKAAEISKIGNVPVSIKDGAIKKDQTE